MNLAVKIHLLELGFICTFIIFCGFIVLRKEYEEEARSFAAFGMVVLFFIGMAVLSSINKCIGN